MHREIENALEIFVGKPEEKRSLRRPRHGWKDNIKWIVKETYWRVWTGLK
jgi:hypothetical protein